MTKKFDVRSAITGRYEKREKAKTDPGHTVKETRKPRKKK